MATYRQQLISEEKSPLTVDKYLRDIRAFGRYAGNRIVTKALVLTYKSELQARYAARWGHWRKLKWRRCIPL